MTTATMDTDAVRALAPVAVTDSGTFFLGREDIAYRLSPEASQRYHHWDPRGFWGPRDIEFVTALNAAFRLWANKTGMTVMVYAGSASSEGKLVNKIPPRR